MSSITNNNFRLSVVVFASALLPMSLGVAQDLNSTQSMLLAGNKATSPSNSKYVTPVLNIERRVDQKGFQGLYADDTLNVNLGLEISPVSGLSLSADAWKLQVEELPAQNQLGSRKTGLPQLSITETSGSEFILQQPFASSYIDSKGIDVRASYVWDTHKAGQFTLSTKATYIYDFSQRNILPEVVSLVSGEPEPPGSPDLQSSLTLTWQFGNHRASAVTNYFDSFKDIGELNIDEINELVENITTFDLQYGYSVKTGKKDRAIISFDVGVRNIFDEKTTQILNQNSRVVDQNGRVAYGSIKYQF